MLHDKFKFVTFQNSLSVFIVASKDTDTNTEGLQHFEFLWLHSYM